MKLLLRRLLVIFPLLILFGQLIGDTTEANAQQLRETFRRVKQSVVIVRTQEKTVAPLRPPGDGKFGRVSIRSLDLRRRQGIDRRARGPGRRQGLR